MSKSKEEERLKNALSKLKVKNKKLQKEIDEANKVKENFRVTKVAFIGVLMGVPAAIVAFIITKFLSLESNPSDLLIGGLIGGIFGAISINNWWFDFIYEKGWLKKISFNFSDK